MMKKYSDYKKSQYEWIGELPNHWQELFLEQTCKEKYVKNIDNIESNVLSLSYGNIIKKKNRDAGLVAKDFATYQIVSAGNIILRLTDLQNDHRSLRTGLVKERGIITSAYTCLEPFHNPAYLHYLLHCYDIRKYFYGLGGGVRQSIGFKDIRHTFIPIPPRAEQDQIVRYLDWQVSKINRLIVAKKKKISLITECKTSKIRSIIENETGKCSKMRLKNIAFSYGRIGFRGYSTSDMVMEGEGAITTSPSNIVDDGLSFDKCAYLSWDKYYESPEIQLVPNDILLVKTGSSYGKTGFVDKPLPEKATINPQIFIIRANEDIIIPDFLYLVIKYGELQEQINRNVIGSTIPTISENKVMNFDIHIPDKDHQRICAREIQSIIKIHNSIIDKIEQEIQTLNELRNKLISDVVTGQIDVRGIEIPDFEYIEETAEITDEDEPTSEEE